MNKVVSIGLIVAAGIGCGLLLQSNKNEERAVTVAVDLARENPFAAARGTTLPEDAAPARTGAYRDDFAALNAHREDVTILPSGVQYEVLEAGNGHVGGPGSTVKMYYEGSLTDGVVFDSNLADTKPRTIQVDSIALPGFREIATLMDEGARWRVVIPPSAGFGRIGNNKLRRRDLIYDIRMVAVES